MYFCLIDACSTSFNWFISANVKNIGLVTSPMLYFAAKKEISKSGIIITGSHNPKNYNGIKMVIDDKPVSGSEILEFCLLYTSPSPRDS